jgi:hypothetical protein
VSSAVPEILAAMPGDRQKQSLDSLTSGDVSGFTKSIFGDLGASLVTGGLIKPDGSTGGATGGGGPLGKPTGIKPSEAINRVAALNEVAAEQLPDPTKLRRNSILGTASDVTTKLGYG